MTILQLEDFFPKKNLEVLELHSFLKPQYYNYNSTKVYLLFELHCHFHFYRDHSMYVHADSPGKIVSISFDIAIKLDRGILKKYSDL